MVINDEGRKINEHGRKHKSKIETELTMDEKQEHKNTKIHGVMKKWKESKEGKAYEREKIWSRHLECGLNPR